MSNNIYDILGKLNSLKSAETPVETAKEPVYESVDAKGDIMEAVRSLVEKYEGFKKEVNEEYCDACDSTECHCESIEEGAKPDFLDLDKDGDTEEPMKAAAKSAKDDEPAKPDSDAVAKRKRLQALKDKQEDERAEKGDDYKSSSRFVKGRAYGGAAQKDDEEKELDEVAPPGAKAERMVKHIKKGYSKDGKLTPKEKGIAYATAWKAHNKGAVEEATEFGDTIENSKAELSDAKKYVTEGELRNHPIYTTQEAWDHYSKELAEQEIQEEIVVDAVQELDEIARLAGLKTETVGGNPAQSFIKSITKDEELDEAATRKDFRAVAELLKNIPDEAKRKELAHHHADIFKQQNPRFKRDVFLAAAGVTEGSCAMGEAEVDEGNEFTKARLDAIAAGKDSFTVGSETYNVSGDTSDEKQQVESVDDEKQAVTEDININVSANGEEDVVNLIRKLSGMPVVAVQASPAEVPCAEETVEEERDIEYVNTPRELTAPISAAIPNGNDLHKVKIQDPGTANKAANPLGEDKVEESLWTAYESMINDLKA